MSRLELLQSPWRVTFETNPEMCNLNCVMCDTHSRFRDTEHRKRGMLPVEHIEEIVSSLHGLGLREIIPSTMGEPLLYPDFERVLEIVSKYGISLNLTTNGTFPRLGVERWGEKILPVASDVKISINGATKKTAESIMVGIDFDRQIENAREFIRRRDYYRTLGLRPTVTMQATFMKSNLNEMAGMVDMAVKMGFDRFKGHHVWVTNERMREESLRTPGLIDEWNAAVDGMQEAAGSEIKLENVEKIVPECKDPVEKICPFLGKEAWIESNLTFNVCCCPSEERKKFGEFGTVSDTPFIDLWDSRRYREFVEGWGNYEPCNHCNMRVEAGKR